MSGLLLAPEVTRAQLDRALHVCERIASRNRSSLYLISRFFEERSRYETHIATYAVMRVVHDLIDTIPNKARLTDFAEFMAYAESATVAPAVLYVILPASPRDRSTGHDTVRGFDFETGRIYLSHEDLRGHHPDDETYAGSSIMERATIAGANCASIPCLVIRLVSDLLCRIDAAPAEVLRGDPIPTMPDKAVRLSRILERFGDELWRSGS